MLLNNELTTFFYINVTKIVIYFMNLVLKNVKLDNVYKVSAKETNPRLFL